MIRINENRNTVDRRRCGRVGKGLGLSVCGSCEWLLHRYRIESKNSTHINPEIVEQESMEYCTIERKRY